MAHSPLLPAVLSPQDSSGHGPGIYCSIPYGWHDGDYPTFLCHPYSTPLQHYIRTSSWWSHVGGCMCFPPMVPRYWTQVLPFMLAKHQADASRNLEVKRCTTNNNCVSEPPLTIWGSRRFRAEGCVLWMWPVCSQRTPQVWGQGTEGASKHSLNWRPLAHADFATGP